MIIRRSLLALTGAFSVAAMAAAPVFPGPAFPVFKDAAQVKRSCDQGLRDARQRLLKLHQSPADGRWLTSFDAFNGWMEDTANPIDFVANVHPDKAIRGAAEQCAQRWQEFGSALFQDERLFKAIRRLRPADAIDAQAINELRENFEEAGVGLPPAQRKRAKQLQDRINLLGQQFETHVRDYTDRTRLSFTEAELAGVPADVWQQAPRRGDGQVELGLDYPTYFPVMEHATQGATRERMWRAKVNEGGAENLRVLDEIATLRREYAALFGQPSYADFLLRRKMAGNVAGAERLLDDVKAAVTPRERLDLAALREAKARELGLKPDEVQLQRWDERYYTERLRRERYQVDQEAFRSYFPPEASLQVVMRLSERLFGVKYTRVDMPLWHADAQAWQVSDARTGEPLAGLLTDLYPREGKYGHAAVWGYRSGATISQRLPQAALVVNFNRKGLTLDELNTLLHEFGHSLHDNLSRPRYTLGGPNSVQHDFVEAPSQMLEDWVYDPRFLALFQEVCASCAKVPDELIARAKVAGDFAKGTQTARQHLYASYDLALHGVKAQEPMALWQRMEGATPLGYVEGTRFPAGFSHIARNYGAGYYGYLWSLVLAMDLRTAFQADRLSPEVGMRYRDTVLSQGAQLPPRELVRQFLGRETNAKAFFDDLNR